jgi:hypothetical protein
VDHTGTGEFHQYLFGIASITRHGAIDLTVVGERQKSFLGHR